MLIDYLTIDDLLDVARRVVEGDVVTGKLEIPQITAGLLGFAAPEG